MRGLVCLTITVQLLLAPVLLQSESRPEVNWALAIEPFCAAVSEGDDLAYWVGLTNKDVVPRAVCLAWVTYEVDSDAGDYVGGGVRGPLGELSPRPCHGKEDWRLVLPGETTFRLVFVSTRQTLGKCRLEVRVDFAEVCVRAEDCRFEPSLAETAKLSATTSCVVRGITP
jgi:hypothetical protein